MEGFIGSNVMALVLMAVAIVGVVAFGMIGMEKDLFPFSTIAPIAATTDQTGATCDLQGYNGALILGHIGIEGVTLSGTDKIEMELEESDDDSNWTDVADADLLGYVDGTNDGCFAVFDANAEAPAIVKAAYVGTKRYIRVIVNYIGTHGVATPVSACVVRGHARSTTGDPV